MCGCKCSASIPALAGENQERNRPHLLGKCGALALDPFFVSMRGSLRNDRASPATGDCLPPAAYCLWRQREVLRLIGNKSNILC